MSVLIITEYHHFHIKSFTFSGATGAMVALANVMPQEILQIYAQAASGKQNEAQQCQQRLQRLSQTVRIQYKSYSTFKRYFL